VNRKPYHILLISLNRKACCLLTEVAIFRKMTADSSESIEIKGGKSNLRLKYHEDLIGNACLATGEVNIHNSDIIFAGYGVNSPENNWNDFEGLDVKGIFPNGVRVSLLRILETR
jgi:hypothetical protein